MKRFDEPHRCPRRAAHACQRGLTLIEAVVTIAIMTISVVGIAAGIAQTHRISNIAQDQSQLEVAMRQLSDFVRDSSSKGLAYHLCAAPASYNSSLPALPSGVTSWTVSSVNLSTSGTRDGVATPPISYCVTPGTCTAGPPAKTCDWGVQEIALTVSSGSRSLTRTVWKSVTW